jgi:threonyl-tRNA synthetase
MINITFPTATFVSMPPEPLRWMWPKSISEGLARVVLAARRQRRSARPDAPDQRRRRIVFYKWEDKEGKNTFWHSSAHLLAEALESLYPGIKFGIGPPIENGFYYDVDTGDRMLTAADPCRKSNRKCSNWRATKANTIRREVSKADAVKYFTEKGDEYKLELIEGLEDGQITFYQQGNFTDLCKGPHIPNTEPIKAVKSSTSPARLLARR